jgi:GNAT superfamily N-acetyltransferase
VEVKMIDIRLAKKDEINHLKEIWKLCFGDEDSFIDFFYNTRYIEDETLVLLQSNTITAMLTMIPVEIGAPNKRSMSSTMLYAIATHPNYQNNGFATQLIEFSHQYLGLNIQQASILVPAEKNLFAFYRKLGYEQAFYIRELLLSRDRISRWEIQPMCPVLVTPISSEEYNRRRNIQLHRRLSVSYKNEEVAYQKKLSQLSGADIYAVDIGDLQGCVTIERANSDKVIIKEMLIQEEHIPEVLKEILRMIPAMEYILRLPAYLGESLGGIIRPFGMIKFNSEIKIEITQDQFGYLGLAFD